LKQHKPLCDEQFPKLLNKRKQAKLQWLQNSSNSNGNNLNNVRREQNFQEQKDRMPERKYWSARNQQ